MRRARALAEIGVGLASPNPTVGAVIVENEKILGEGFHVYREHDHAEIRALRQAGQGARGADLYVTLEPCSHTGRTPPCTDAVLKAGIRRVFFGCPDPNPRVSGRGLSYLVEQGVEVLQGPGARACEELNRPFSHFISSQQPYVSLKLAVSLDGKIAAADNSSQWITSKRARRRVQEIRFENDAILVGIGTVLKDDPSLTTRGLRPRQTLKVILDSELQIPSHSRLFEDGEVLIFHDHRQTVEKERPPGKLEGVRRSGKGLSWQAILDKLGQLQIQRLLIEGGATVAGTALASGVIKRCHFFVATALLGAQGKQFVDGLQVPTIRDAIRLKGIQTRRWGPDTEVICDLEES